MFLPNAANVILEKNLIRADFDHVLGNRVRLAINKTMLKIVIFIKLHLNT